MKKAILLLLLVLMGGVSYAQNSLLGKTFNVRQFGATGDGSTNDTTAVAAAVSAWIASPGSVLYFPAGTYSVTPGTITITTNSVSIRGDGVGVSVLKNRTAGSAITLDNTSNITHSILIENLSITGFGTGSTDTGITVSGSGQEPFGLTVRRVTIGNMAGRGVYVSNNLFTSRFVDLDVSVLAAGTNGIDISGASDIALERCYVHTVGTNGAAYRVHAGVVTLIACNGIDSGTTADWMVLGDSTGTGDPTDRYARANLIGCNIEAFTNRGVYAKSGSYVNKYEGVTILAPASGTVTPIKYDFVDTGQRGTWDAASSINTQGASYTNGYAINSSGAPFVQIGGTTLTSYYDTGAGSALTLPSLTTQLVSGSTNTAIKISRGQITALESSGLVGDLTGATSYTGDPARVLLQAGTNSRPTLASTDVNTTGIYFPSSGTTIGFSVSGTQRLLLGSQHTFTGNLGINTAGNSSYALDVASGALRVTNSNGSSTAAIEAKGNSNPYYLLTDSSASAIIGRMQALSGAPDRLAIGAFSNHPLGFYTNSTEKWTIQAAGDFVPGSAGTYSIGTSSLPVLNAVFSGKVAWSSAGSCISSGSGTPEGSVTCEPGSIYLRTNGSWYIKSSGSSSTGWTLVSSGGGAVSGSGTTNTLAKFTAATTLGDSLVTESTSPNTVTIGARESITGLTINTDATNTVASLTSAATFTKNDTNTRAFDVVRIKPTLNFGGSNTGTTVNFLTIDSTNTATTGATVNLINASYGGSLKFSVDSAGAVTFATGVRQVFVPSSTVASLNFGQVATDPSSGVNGDCVYQTGSNKFRCYENGAWANMIGATPTLTSTQVPFGDGSNLLTSSSAFTYNTSTKVLSIVNGSGATGLTLNGSSDTSNVKFGAASMPGNQGGVFFPFVGGAQSSGPGVWWGSSASYSSLSGLWISFGLNWQGANSSHDPFMIREGTGTSSNGTVRYQWNPSTSLFEEMLSTAATGTAFNTHKVTLTSTGTAAANFGAYDLYVLENASGSNVNAVQLSKTWTTATAGAETGKFAVATNLAGLGVGDAFTVDGGQFYGTLWNKGNISGSVTLDFINGNVVTATLTGNVTSLAFSNLRTGGIYYIHFIQDALGPWTLTVPAALKVNGGYTISAGVNKRDLLICSATSTTQLYCSKAQDQQ